MRGANYEPISPLLFLLRSGQAYRDKLAIVDGDKSYTFGGLLQHVVLMRNAFLASGCVAGDRATYLCRNNFQMVIAHYAVGWFGGVLVPINICLEPSAVAYILKNSAAKLLFIDKDFLREEYRQAVNEIIITDDSSSSSLHY